MIELKRPGSHSRACDGHRSDCRTSIELLGTFHQGAGGESDRRGVVQRLPNGPNRLRNSRGMMKTGDHQDRLRGRGKRLAKGCGDRQGGRSSVRMPVGRRNRQEIRGRRVHSR